MYPQQISRIRCSTQTREYPTTGHAAAAPGGLLDAARTPTVQTAGLMITVGPRRSSWAISRRALAASLRRRCLRRDLCQDTDPRAPSQQSSGNQDPRAIHLTGSHAPVCADVAGRPPILISQCSDSKSATDYTPCTVGSSSGRPDRSGGMYPFGWV